MRAGCRVRCNRNRENVHDGRPIWRRLARLGHSNVTECRDRTPLPRALELQPNYYVVRDADGQQIAYVYYSNEPNRRTAAKLLNKDEARRIAMNFAKLPMGRKQCGTK